MTKSFPSRSYRTHPAAVPVSRISRSVAGPFGDLSSQDLPGGEFHALGDGLCLALDLVDEPLLNGARLEKPKTAKTTEMMIKIGKLKSSTLFILHTSFFSGGLRWVHGTDIRLYPRLARLLFQKGVDYDCIVSLCRKKLKTGKVNSHPPHVARCSTSGQALSPALDQRVV